EVKEEISGLKKSYLMIVIILSIRFSTILVRTFLWNKAIFIK
ncbi:hypothetical protein HRED_09527, partial [Candidatus Haloredivivus sp. G17]